MNVHALMCLSAEAIFGVACTETSERKSIQATMIYEINNMDRANRKSGETFSRVLSSASTVYNTHTVAQHVCNCVCFETACDRLQ